ncbi:MAG: translational GTPase TypA [Verrucomicrobia bacterium]|nr:translational GTPase TypA [Verrucomicrobiota bacterium]NDB75889.1 translational GTPase TypA [Verrucomicrobiota bacterium]NDD38902.1 translational GTPase TypA [Verrucomicrobiota bacterium]NDE98730.1 translational GTPase TypA [Verrucomicrobiota bacterium]
MQHIRNIAIIAHVDHGKTTLVDCLLKQSGTFRANQAETQVERLMDSMDLEREKGITIRAKNAAFKYKNYHINIVDTPGHADFGGEVERIMNMIDGVLLVVDSTDGPQAQTRFVLRKALEAGAKPIVVINKIDRANATPKKVLDLVFELFLSLNATDEQLDFPFIYCSAKDGYAKLELEHVSGTMEPLFDAIVKHIPPPRAKAGDGFQVLVANLDYSDYLGRIAFGKIVEGKVKVGDPAICRHGDGRITKGKITMIYHFEGMKRIEIQEAHAGDIVGLTGFEDVFIGETICDSELRPAIPYIPIDPPTIQMEFAVNDGPLAGQDGKLVTARHIWDRLVKEIRTNVALRIAQTSDPKIFAVSGRGEMQIAILVEQMRREGHEVLVSRPEVLWKKGPNDTSLEPIEKLYVEVPNENLGSVMENLSHRKAQITNMNHVANTVSVEALVPMRGLIGFETDLVNMTKGMGVMSHLFHEYGEDRGEIPARKNGSLVSMDAGEATPYALNMVQERGRLLVEPGDQIYVGMIVGENARDNDLAVNPVKEKKLTNMRSQGDGKGIQLAPPMKLSLERALEYIDVDEYVEATPKHLRLRKKVLDENARKRSEKSRSIKYVEG